MNKKGNFFAIIIFFSLLFIILMVGVILVMGSSILNLVFDTAMPVFTDLGMVEQTNLSQVSELSLTPVNSVIQSFTWMAGVLYLLMILGSVVFVVVMGQGSSRWLIGFYFALMILLIFGSILMSNIYEDFYNDTDDIGLRLQEHFLLSHMILYSPMIFTIIGFIVGVLLFSGIGQEEYV